MKKYNINSYGDKIVPCSICGRDTQDLKESVVTICIDCVKIDLTKKKSIIPETTIGKDYG